MVKAKQRRVEKSRQNNPLYTGPGRKRSAQQSEEAPAAKEGNKKWKPSAKATTKAAAPSEEDVQSFAGTTGKPGVTRAHGKFFLKKQAALHVENLKSQKKKAKSARQLQSMKVEQAASRKEAKVSAPRNIIRRKSCVTTKLRKDGKRLMNNRRRV